MITLEAFGRAVIEWRYRYNGVYHPGYHYYGFNQYGRYNNFNRYGYYMNEDLPIFWGGLYHNPHDVYHKEDYHIVSQRIFGSDMSA